MRKILGDIVDSHTFQWTIFALILFAALLVGLETSRSLMAEYGKLLHWLDRIVVFLFVVEAIMKMARHGKHFYRYFYEPWNVFDFIIVVVCLLPMNTQFAAVLRLARVLRVLRLISIVPKLQLLVNSLLKSMPSMVYVGLLLFLLFYIYAVLGVFLFRENDPKHFGTLGDAFLSLFRVITLEDWTDILYIQMYGSNRYAFELDMVASQPTAQPLVSVVYFVSFVLFGTMIMLNLFIGVILNSMEEAQREREMQVRRAHIAQKGDITLADELTLLEHEFEELHEKLHDITKRLHHHENQDHQKGGHQP